MTRSSALRLSPVVVLAAFASVGFTAKVVGVSQPAPSLTQARIDQLPRAQRAAWTAYLQRSTAQEQTDRAALAAERKGLTTIPDRPAERGFPNSMPLNRDPSWYGTPEARHVGDVIISFQTPGGGWSKNMSMGGDMRKPGQTYAPDNVSKYLGPEDFDTPRDREWNYISTLDNNATTTEMRFLALVAAATAGAAGEPYRASFIRGVHYLLNAQYPNGGWPQVWPLEGGYHDAITFNDNAVTLAAEVLTDTANGSGTYAFVPADLRKQARAAAAHALDCIVAAQVIVNGKRTAWAQQHDPLTLAPVSGRNFEPAALSSGESADVLVYLMSLPNPSPAVQAAIHAGIAWLNSTAIRDQQWTGTRAEGRHLVPTPGAGPIWSRYYSITTGQPIFGDRDKTFHDDVAELSLERRNGYQWYSSGPQHALDVYADWSKTHPLTNGGKQ